MKILYLSQSPPATRADGIRIADAPEALAREILTLLMTPALRHQGALQARHYVEHHHCWQDHGAALEALLHKTTRQPAY
jgi:hypothetical protein